MMEDVEIRRRRRIIWIVLTIISLPFLFCAYQRMYGINLLKAKLHDLKRAGEEMDYRKFARPVPAAESNAVVALTNLFPYLDAVDGLLRGRPPEARLEADHRQRPYFNVDEWEFKVWVGDVRESRTNDWASFTSEFELHTNLLADVLSALRLPEFHSGYDPDDGFAKLPMEALMNSRRVGKLLAAGFSFHVRQGRFDEAAECLVALLRLVRWMRHDRLIISEMIGHARFYTTRQLIWQGLQLDGWTDEQLAAWSAAIGRLDFAGQMIDGHRMERALGYNHFRRLGGQTGNAIQRKNAWDTAWETLERNSMNEYFNLPMWRLVWREQDYCQNLDSWTARINQLRSAREVGWLALLRARKGGGPLPFQPTEFRSPPDTWWNSHRYLFSRNSFAFLDADGTARKVMSVVAARRITAAAIAIRRYVDRHGKTPPSLDDLVPEFLQSIPKDPMDLKPLRYRNDGDSWSLYSIGENGTDDGGDFSPLKPGAEPVGVMDRKDIVWPQTAK